MTEAIRRFGESVRKCFGVSVEGKEGEDLGNGASIDL